MKNLGTDEALGLVTFIMALAFMLFVAFVFAGCSTARASACVSTPPMCPATTAPVCICDDGSCRWVCVGFTP